MMLPAWIRREFRPARDPPAVVPLPASGDFPDSPKTLRYFNTLHSNQRRYSRRRKPDFPDIKRERVSDHSLSRSRVRRMHGRFAIIFHLYEVILGAAEY